MSEETIIRLGIVLAGVLLMALIFWFGKPGQKTQGIRREKPHDADRPEGSESIAEEGLAPKSRRPKFLRRTEPGTATAAPIASDGDDVVVEMDAEGEPELEFSSSLGRRKAERVDKVIKLYVAARAGNQFDGSDVVVAAEKIGTVYGYGNAFHRLVERKPSLDPIYTVANVQHQGSLDINTIADLQTPAIAFYLMLPAPIPAFDAFEMMLPAARRASELLNGVLLDEQQNVVSKQTVAHIREELRAYDREHEILASGAPPSASPKSDKSSRWS